MSNEQIRAEIAAIRAKREGKRGRMPNVDRDRIAELEAQLEEPEMSEETVGTPEETVEMPAGTVRKRTAIDSLCIPAGAMTRMVPKGSIVDVPQWFADEMGEKLEDV